MFLKSRNVDKNIIGIDLGTTNSLAAYIKDNKSIVIKDTDGKKVVPSIVYLSNNEELIGNKAKNMLITDPLNTIFASKRLIGRKLSDSIFKSDNENFLQKLPYLTKEDCSGRVKIITEKGVFSPVEIGAKILKYIKEYVSKVIGKDVGSAVITVPAYFNDTQRQATKDAGQLAGWNVLRIINEPTAAALAYGLDKKREGYIAVYDLGGGTFDISILEIKDGIFQVKSTNGNTFLGGEDFDSEFVKFLANMFHMKEGIDISSNKEALNKLKISAEIAKKKLTDRKNVNVFVENIVDGLDFDVDVSREQFNSSVKRVALRTIEPCEEAVKDAGITKDQIKDVVVVGGMTKVPLVREIVKDIFKIEPKTDIDPDEAVAKGAAIQGGIISGNIKDALLLDVIPLSLGIETLGGVYSKIINKNTTIPFKQTETFSTSKDNQTDVEINVFQGERLMVEDNIQLGKIKLSNIPKAKRGVPKIDVTFEADVNGILKVSAVERNSNVKQEVKIESAGGLSKEELEKLIKESKENQLKDSIKKQRIEFTNKVIDETNDFISGEKKLPKEILDKILQLRKSAKLKDNDLNKLKNDFDSLIRIIK
uniref:Heat shock protein 70 n=2 Tax=Hepatospora eriocheir TaxID=1081669 RepID=A0A144LCJ9_9MICR|nr:heat shock protein 70 [Hepatospora eriocheir 'edible crab parasite']